ncbi:MAG: ornithine cyclodeaminase family protein [Candidatus Kariarchaeaceae archaeon]
MSLLIISAEEVKMGINMDKYIDLMIDAHGELQRGEGFQPLRSAMVPPNAKGLVACMPAYLSGNKEIMGLKVVTVFDGNHKLGLDSHQGVVMLLNPETGVVQAIVDGREITAMRTAAASAAATKYLARSDSKHLAIIGTGVQGHTHLEAISTVRDIQKVTVWNRTHEKAKSFVDKYASQFDITALSTVEEAVASADIICTATASTTPLVSRSMVKAGVHINAVGTATPDSRELDTSLITSSSLFTDVYESAMNEAGEIAIPIKEGLLTQKPQIVELGDLVNGIHPGRKIEDEITIYKSLGVGIQDIIVANYVYEWAKENSKGQSVEFD